MTVTRPSIWKLKVKLLPFSSSKTSAGETLAALLDSSGISGLLRLLGKVLVGNVRRGGVDACSARAPSGGASLTDSRPPRSLTAAFADDLFCRLSRQLFALADEP